VTAFVIRVYYEGKWLTQWNESAILPHGIEIIIKLENIGTIRKIIPLLNENFQPEMNR
ncbi:type II secretion system protein GspJ, partial [Yersinia proxima]|uniref:type II secretion system protein GspJ n=1 Tax=Yersinia proxima TaxID=2890316 RepID=UPI00387F871D